MLSVFYLGSKVQCPVCAHSFRKFLPYGRQSRDNALCPNCLALERHRAMWLFLKKKTDFFLGNYAVLHIAPEICFIDRFEKLPNIKYTTADLESPLAKVKLDIHKMPFENDSFDIVFCNHVMEHVQNDKVAMQEIFRVLRSGGWAIIQIPVFHPIPKKTLEDPSITDPGKREELFGQDDHVRRYGLDYPDRLRTAGFTVKLVDMVEEMGETLAKRYAIPKGDPIHFCQKTG